MLTIYTVKENLDEKFEVIFSLIHTCFLILEYVSYWNDISGFFNYSFDIKDLNSY